MKKAISAMLLGTLFSSYAQASEKSVEAMAYNYVENHPPKKFDYITPRKEKVADCGFWTMAGLVAGSTVYDIESTFYLKRRADRSGGQFKELNPGMAPFIKMGRPGIYPVQFGFNYFLLKEAYNDKKSHKKWWIAPLVISGIHTFAGTSNMLCLLCKEEDKK